MTTLAQRLGLEAGSESSRPLAGPRAADRSSSTRWRGFYLGVVAVQGIHVVEHVIQLVQVTVFHVPDEQALGLLGYVFQFHGTEEWLHFVFNAAYLASLYAVAMWLVALVRSKALPAAAFRVFVVGAIGLETWHFTEHVVIIYHAIRNGRCPCNGIGDVVLGVSDTYLHFGYNTIAYGATVVPFWFLAKVRRAGTVTV